jgi:hypothetical protein
MKKDKEEVVVAEVVPVEVVAEVVVESIVEIAEPVIVPVVKPSFNKEEVVAKLAELSNIFRNLYGEQLNPIFAEISKSLSHAQYKIMQNT